MKKQPQQPEEKPEEPELKDVIWWPPSLTDEINKNWPSAMKQQGGY